MEDIIKFSDFESLNESKGESAKDALLNVGKTLQKAKDTIKGEIEELTRIKKVFKKDTKSLKVDLIESLNFLNKVLKNIESVSKDDKITYK